jgi:dipeptidyl aminopeptidase/acylaminoacyl peptidase
MLTWPDEDFVCDGHYTTAFPPQPLASAGFAVAIFNVYDAFGSGANEPSGPPQTKEAESTVASVESLIDFLDKKGIILRDDVGIIGFSRSSWKVDYFLTHSDFTMRAASSADGGLGNYGNLWTTDGSGSGEVATSYGGLFFSPSRSAWLAGAPAFNADKVSAPLLMEYTGADGRLDQPIGAYEFHSALVGLGKPVDLFFYPRGSHPLDTPFERIASLERNVDWFRFWMQGYESTPPEYDPEQYVRWRKLRESQSGPSRLR